MGLGLPLRSPQTERELGREYVLRIFKARKGNEGIPLVINLDFQLLGCESQPAEDTKSKEKQP